MISRAIAIFLAAMFIGGMTAQVANAGENYASITYKGERIELVAGVKTDRSCFKDVASLQQLAEQQYGKLYGKSVNNNTNGGWATVRGYFKVGYEKVTYVHTCYYD